MRRTRSYEQYKKACERAAKLGYVYVIASEDNKRVKIGHSIDPLRRIRTMQYGSSQRLRLIGAFPGGKSDEETLHSLLRDVQVHGEWFDCNEELLAFLRRYTRSKEPIISPTLKEAIA
jgi:hypothetical protein